MGAAAVAASLLLTSTPAARAQAVIFPQAVQPGTASSSIQGDDYVLQNDLLSAAFVRQDGHLLFDGCEAMNLKAGTELFAITLGDGTVVRASEMTLGDIALVDLAPDAQAAKGALRLSGKAIVAELAYGDLRLEWRAVLRDGSHYFRTELRLTAAADQPMQSVTPMIYDVDNTVAGSVPTVVGNTRGAILASDRLFAGLETPMGINIAGTETDMAAFTARAWTERSFIWTPGNATPGGILALGFSAEDIAGARGYVTFKEAGDNKLTFTYRSGNHRLNMVGVDLTDADGNVVASDYHTGYTGNSQSLNAYTLRVPKPGSYILRYFVETRTETIASAGDITFDKKVKTPVVVYDLPPGSATKPLAGAPAVPAPAGRVLGGPAIGEDETLADSWTPADWQPLADVPLRINELGFYAPDVKGISRDLAVESRRGTLSAEFVYVEGSSGLNIVGVDMVDADGNVVAYDYHKGFSGGRKTDNVYKLSIPYAGQFKLRYLIETKTEPANSSGSIRLELAVTDTLHLAAPATTPITGTWNRNTMLCAGQTWSVSAVVGLIAPGQARRSVLAYSERERAVPWRPYPVYISWYELNIDRNNATAPDYKGNMTVGQCTDVVKHWKTSFYDAYKAAPKAFVWDDGWDEYGTWTFNRNFPNGFREPADEAGEMGTGIGAWLGPVGGYGTSGNYRRAYWNDKGGMQLSNVHYYRFFVDACLKMIADYDFRFFKFDGISAQFSATGPDTGATGEENAEAIISIERELRQKKADIFLNTTVGTWASPFWFQFTDAVWRQENDYGEIGDQGTDRERWITYRDRLVYQNFVQNSPLCPINTLMTHGFILTRHGNVSKAMDYAGIVRELRCAFACGSGMVELYNDYDLMDAIADPAGRKGALWKDLAECIAWQERNADVLPDVHWVGGNPWDGMKANVYGWAAWNGKRATLALRNPAATPQHFTLTLREALDIPAYVSTTVTLNDAFTQSQLDGLATGTPTDIDAPLTLTLPASSVFVFDGTDNNPLTAIGSIPGACPHTTTGGDSRVFDLSGRQYGKPQPGLNIVGGKKVIVR